MKIASKVSLMVMLSAAMYLGAPAREAMALPQPPAAPSGTINWQTLKLTPDQNRKINILRLDFNQQAIKLKADIAVKQLEIQKLLMSPAANPNRIRQLLQEKLTMESKLQASSLDNFLAIKKLLTSEQLVKLSQAVVIK